MAQIWTVESLATLTDEGRPRPSLAKDWTAPAASFDAVLLHGSLEQLAETQQALSLRSGPVIGVERLAPGDVSIPMERLVVERSLSINTAAAGGNASLMTLG